MNENLLFTITWFHLLVLCLPVSLLLLYRWPRLWQPLFSTILGIIAGMIDRHSGEAQLTVILLLIFGVFLGFSGPHRAWRWGILLGMSVPLFSIGAHLQGDLQRSMVSEGVFSAVAILPALAGVYLGSFVRSQNRIEADSESGTAKPPR